MAFDDCVNYGRMSWKGIQVHIQSFLNVQGYSNCLLRYGHLLAVSLNEVVTHESIRSGGVHSNIKYYIQAANRETTQFSPGRETGHSALRGLETSHQGQTSSLLIDLVRESARELRRTALPD